MNRLAGTYRQTIFPGCHRFVWAVVFATVSLGCGGDPGPKTYRVSGIVQYDNKPVPYGSIQFLPDSSKSNSGPMGYAVILDGKFDTKAAGGRGVVGGPHQVIVTGMKSPPPTTTQNPDDVTSDNILFPQHTMPETFKEGENELNISVSVPAK